LTENSKDRSRVLVCPLNWGLGHAARDIPIIRHLTGIGYEVFMAGDGPAIELLRTEFPELETIPFRSIVKIRYSAHLPAWLKITLLSPLLFYEIFSEHLRLGRIIRKLRPSLIISDNRYGLWNRRVHSILITHQLSIPLPRIARFLEYPAYLVAGAFIGKFDRCWIPDFPGSRNLSGKLSHRYKPPGNSVFIGALSRFHLNSEVAVKTSENRVKLLMILSGPEPQRSRLHNNILAQVMGFRERCVILEGRPGKLKRVDLTSTVTSYNHLPASELNGLIQSAENVICRAGYTGIMDLALMRKKALIIPTPGQTEQVYLADYLSSKGMFLTCGQDDLDLIQVLEDLDQFTPVFNLPDEVFPNKKLEDLI